MSSKEQAARTVPWQYDLFPCESTIGGVNGLRVLPVSNQSIGLQWTRSCVPSLCVIRLCSCLRLESVASVGLDESDAVQADHLLEIDVLASLVSIDILKPKTKVRAL
ncbi:hypothetical protein K443DRAFT_553243 [Laccaria amethystina LaAM-08-1]|uniref:Uncharacterized protein n=1 Tax=Laccaria amethystina LaAM-08-1 TaxID=1095629 RepID=A0A0C9X9L8_9AGAR|nr:hypothetical protein K443DRAFT_553243 [Laccaria amethystina LaAM-08-1]